MANFLRLVHVVAERLGLRLSSDARQGRARPALSPWAAAVLALSAALIALGGCSDDSSGSSSADAVADSVDSAGDDAEDIQKFPSLKAKLLVSPDTGNAPLPVDLTVTFEGASREELFVTWDFGDGPTVNFDMSKPD